MGTIDEKAIDNLSLVVNLSKNLQISKNEKCDDPDALAEFFPSFLWIIRDFTLKLVDEDMNTISSKQYLEKALKEVKGSSDAVEQKNRIRRMVKHFFQDRDC